MTAGHSHDRTCLTTCMLLLGAPYAIAEQAPPTSISETLSRAAEQVQNGRAREALATLQSIEQQEPDNPWLWFYKGSAHLHLGEPHAAIDSYDRGLAALEAAGNPDPKLTDAIQTHRRLARQQVFRFLLRSGLAYDTNVSFLSGGVTGPGLIAGRGDGLFSSSTRLDYSPIVNSHETLTVGARLGHSWHFSVEQFDFQDYGGYARYARKIGERTEVALQYDYDMTYLGNDSFLSDHAISPGIAYRWDSTGTSFQPDTSRLYYRFEARDFLFDTIPSFDRDGFANSVGVEQSFLFRPIERLDWTWELAVGYRFVTVATEGSEFDRFSHGFDLGASVPVINPADPSKYLILPDKELTFRFGVGWQVDDYRRPSALDSTRDERSDLITNYVFALTQTLLDDWRYGNLKLHAVVDWMDADSNIKTANGSSPLSYDKVVYGVQLEWTW